MRAIAARIVFAVNWPSKSVRARLVWFHGIDEVLMKSARTSSCCCVMVQPVVALYCGDRRAVAEAL